MHSSGTAAFQVISARTHLLPDQYPAYTENKRILFKIVTQNIKGKHIAQVYLNKCIHLVIGTSNLS